MSRLLVGLVALFAAGCTCSRGLDRGFDLREDGFAFRNELRWEYDFQEDGGVVTRKTKPAPEYSLRCFPMVRSAREFFYHAEFRPELSKVSENEYRRLVGEVVARNSRCPDGDRIQVPGYANLNEFSDEHGELLKEQCGGATMSFLQRGNWRMVFPVSKTSYRRTAERFVEELGAGKLPIAHVYRFPNTTLYHAILIYAAKEVESGLEFQAYDPNDPSRPARLVFDAQRSGFWFERNRYFRGGRVRVYEVYRGIFY